MPSSTQPYGKVIGQRSALLIVRDLLLGPERFSDLIAGLPSASPNVISQRLRELASQGLSASATSVRPPGCPNTS